LLVGNFTLKNEEKYLLEKKYKFGFIF